MKKDYESLDDMIHDAKKRAMDLLQRQDRTESNLTEKLTAEGFPQSIVSIAIDYVKSYHYIDDIRYAENYIRFHMQDRSKQRLTYDMLKKGVSRDDIDEALSSTYEVNKIDKLYEAFFLVAKQKVDKYVFEQIKLQLVRNNQYLPGTSNKTYINWRYPDKDSSSLSFTDEYHFSAVFSSRNGDIIYYYEVKRTSFLNILINLGGILKFVGLLLYIPNIWNKYFRQKALLTLNFFFDHDSMESDNKLLPDENDKEEKLTVKHSQTVVDWKKLTFTQWVCARFCCCFSSTYKLIKNERKKTLKELESASFIRFGFDGKWVDIRSYMPGYIAK